MVLFIFFHPQQTQRKAENTLQDILVAIKIQQYGNDVTQYKQQGGKFQSILLYPKPGT